MKQQKRTIPVPNQAGHLWDKKGNGLMVRKGQNQSKSPSSIY